MAGPTIINFLGYAIDGEENVGDEVTTGPIGSLTSVSKNKDDGFWCPVCFDAKNKHFSWTTSVNCPRCKTKIEKMDRKRIKEIMRKN